MVGPIEIVASTAAFQGRLLEVVVDDVRLPSGRQVQRERVHHPGGCAVVPVDSGGRVLLVRQSRAAVSSRLLELPAGKLDRPDEDAGACARRELEEETGYRCGTLQALGSFLPAPGYSDERIQLFLATVLEFAGRPAGTDEGEDITIEWMDLGDAVRAVEDGRIEDAKTALGILLAAGRREGLSSGTHGRLQ